LKTADVEERPLTAEMKLLAQVFATTPEILASASIQDAEAERLEKQKFNGAKLVRLDRASITATRRVEAIFALQKNPPPQRGDFIELLLASEPRSALAVPKSALLDGATGTFVYVLNGENYLRTPVKVGIRSGEFVEITDGLYAGDVVVTAPVDQLWLAELRLTKGGGHSH
jgi:multidrug efflux pump subunit AcrA (membrane-fusion protein)